MKQVTQSTLRFSRALSVVRLAFAVVLVVSALGLNAQVKDAKTSLDLGSVTVWLGMPKEEVVKRCASAGYKVLDSSGNDVVIIDGQKVTVESRIFRATFKNGRVTFASRTWYSSKAKPFEAVLGALEQLGDARGGCFVFHDQDKSPDSAWDRVSITCGFRRVVIESGNMNGEPVADVYEQIDSRER